MDFVFQISVILSSREAIASSIYMGSELGGPEMYPYEKPRRLPKAQVICFKGHPLKQRMEPFISIGNMYTCIRYR